MVPRFVSEGKKIDHLVHENEGSRKLANQIVHQVFRSHGNKEEKFAFGKRVSIFQAHCILTFSLEQKFKCAIEKITQEMLFWSFL